MPEMMDFEFEFYAEDIQQPGLERDLRAEAEGRLRELATGHDDMVGASVAIEKPAQRETAYIYEGRVVAYVRPKDVIAVEKADGALAPLQDALDAVERQIREQRERLRKPWEQP